MKKSILTIFFLSGISSVTMAAIMDAGKGIITFEGSIIEAACGISPGSEDQSINLGNIAKIQLLNGRSSTPVPFSIKLVDCDTSFIPEGRKEPITTASVTFTGAGAMINGSESSELLAIKGTATGAGIVISGINGEVVTINDKTKTAGKITLQDSENTLLFSANLKGFPGSTASTINAGTFTSVTNFTMSYE